MSARDYFIAEAAAHEAQAQAYELYRNAELITPFGSQTARDKRADRLARLTEEYRKMAAACVASAEKQGAQP